MGDQKKIAWLFPFSKFFENSVSNFILAEKLKEKGYKNTFIFCRGALQDYCGPLAASNAKTTLEKKRICEKCVANAEAIRKHITGPVFWMKKIGAKKIGKISDQEKSKISQFCRLDNSLDEKKPILNKKLVEPYYKRAALQSLLNAKCFLKKEKPDFVISDNSLYANINVWRHRCAELNIPFYSSVVGPLLGSSFGFLSLTKEFSDRWYDEAIKKWILQGIKKNSKSIKRLIAQHLNILRHGAHYIVYSSSEKEKHSLLKEIPQARQKYKRVILIALSSEDESIVCAETSGRRKPLGWIRSQNYLLKWVKKKSSLFPDYYFIIRIHPRTAKTKRENKESDDLREKIKFFGIPPSNVYLDLPPQQASIYALFKQVDLVLTSWSSVGWEALAFGVPSICLVPGKSFYPANLNYAIPKGYSDLEKMLTKECTFKRQRHKKDQAYNWYCFLYQKGLIKLPEVLRNLGEKKPFLSGIKFRLMRFVNPTYDIDYFFSKALRQSFSVQNVVKLLETRSVSFFNLQNH